MVLAAGDRLGPNDVPANIREGAARPTPPPGAEPGGEAERIRRALAECPSKKAAAQRLGIPLRTLYRRIKTYGLEDA